MEVWIWFFGKAFLLVLTGHRVPGVQKAIGIKPTGYD